MSLDFINDKAEKTGLPCWRDVCGSSDACALYLEKEPHLSCFSCGEQTWDEQLVESYMGMESIPTTVKIDAAFPHKGQVLPLAERGISKAVAEFYGVESIVNSSNIVIGRAFPFYDEEGQKMIAQKVKGLSKDGEKKKMKCVGQFSAALLFGQQLFSSGGRFVTITEGEEDAMAAYQMFKNHYGDRVDPICVSIKSGGASALRDCKNNWEWLNSFDNIIICFDNDEVGHTAAKRVAELFPSKAKIMHLTEKDANEYLKEGKQESFLKSFFNAEKYAPQGIRTFRSLWDDMTRTDTNTVVPFPWDGVNDMVYGMISGKMDVLKAPPKVGKTSLLAELIMHVRKESEYSVGAILLENTTKEIGMMLCGIEMNLPLNTPSCEVDEKALKEAHEAISEDDRIVIFDPAGERTAENILNKIRYFAKGRDCKYIFLDHASMLAYTSDNMDERKFLDKLFADLKDLTISLDIYICVVIHVNDDGKTRGSRAPVQLCDRLFSLQRDKLNPDPVVANTTEFIVEENRNGSAGSAANLQYDHETGRMHEVYGFEKLTEGTREVSFDD